MAQALEPIIAEVHAGFAFELIGEQAAAHADLAMDAPDREVDAFRVQGLLPGEDVLVDAVDQRSVEIEQKDGLDAHGSGSSSGLSRRVRLFSLHGLIHCFKFVLSICLASKG